jgi:signal transduction histidine kinase
MKDFLKYVFATITGIIMLTIVMAILGTISLVGLAASSASTTQVEENSVFTLMLSGQLEERAQSNPLASLTGEVGETLGLDDILNASAMDSGNYRISYESGEKDFMAQAAISSAEHRLQPGVTMTYEPKDPEPFTFTTDPRRVQQILINLLTNACKHTSAGEIRLGCSLQEIPGMLAFSVEDTGSGIPPEEAQRIFERFVKLDDFVQGTGLGLSICREIADKMGGRIYLDTSYSHGARFVFAVPVI